MQLRKTHLITNEMINAIITSDLHIDKHENYLLLNKIHDYILQINPTLFIICGDISHSLQKIEESFKIFQFPETKVIFVPGNHDLWQLNSQSPNSWDKYYIYLPQLCRKYGIVPIWCDPLIINDIGFCGSIGWYDYTLKAPDSTFTEEDYAKKQFKRMRWNDKLYVNWQNGWDDKSICNHFISELEAQISKINSEVERLIIISHFLTFEGILLWHKFYEWHYFGTYMGSSSVGKMLSKYDKIRYVFNGHIHVEKMMKINNSIDLLISPIGYPKEWKHRFSSSNELIKNRLYLLNLE